MAYDSSPTATLVEPAGARERERSGFVLYEDGTPGRGAADELEFGDRPPPHDPPTDDGGGGGDGEPVRWVTVAAFDQSVNAHLARLRLEAEGIDCVLIDENLVATDWLMSNAVGGIKLQVPAPDASRARDLLSHGSSGLGVVGGADAEQVFDGLDRCPRCGSDAIYPARLARGRVFLSILLLGIPLPFLYLTRRTRCAGCRSEWR